MKKITLLFLAFLLVCNVNAKVRNQDEARQLAGSFLQSGNGTLQKVPAANSALNLSYVGLNTKIGSTTQNQPLYFVYNVGDNSGFVIVSADDRAQTILGYSDNGTFNFDIIPDNFRYWLSLFNNELTALSETPESLTPELLNGVPLTLDISSGAIQKSKSSANSAVAPLLGGIKWNQSSPYNDMCPLLPPANTQRGVTGCIATAMAQIMKYYEWPVTGTGSHSYTTATLGIPLSVTFSSTTYDWANMTDTYGTSSTQTEKDAVATLMYHCGVGTDMDYNTESGTSVNKAASALKTYFGYDTNLQLMSRNYYSRAEWISTLKSEIDASRPVFYTGTAISGGGHAFVCDGYDPNDLFHFNWGWGGMSNGYYAITALNPNSLGIGGGNGQGYNANQTIITGFQEPSGSSVESFILNIDTLMESSVATTTRSGVFDINVNQFWNLGINTFSGSIGLALYNNSGLVQILDQGTVTIPSYNGWNTLTFNNVNVPGSVSNGSYKLYAIYKGTSEPNWQIVRGKVGTPNYITTTITSTQIQFSTDGSVFPSLTNNSLSVTGNLYQNKTGRFNVNITNSGGEYNSNMIVYLQSTSNPSNYQYVVTNPTNIASGETVDKQYYGTVTVAPGEYYYAIYYDPINNLGASNYTLLGFTVVNVLAEPAATYSLSMVDLMSFPDNNNVPKNNAVLTANITNTSGYFENKMIAFIFPSGGGSSLAYIGYQNVILDAGETLPITFSGSIDLPNGDYEIAAYYYDGSTWVNISPTMYSIIDFTLGNIVWTENPQFNSKELLIYPNPVNDKLFIKTDKSLENINIYDLSGRKVINLNPGRNGEIEVQADLLQSGVYILQTTDSENNSNLFKFIKK